MKQTSRRQFLQRSSAALAAAGLLADTAAARKRAGKDDLLRVALIGCGGRGTGAAVQALSTEGSVQLVAMADAFRDRLDSSLAEIAKHVPAKLDVPESRKFVGFDAYEQAMALDIDVVILATPPGYRPMHFEHAVARGHHVFMEKPVAVDAPGIRRVLAAAEVAKQQNLKVGVGLQRHHSKKYLETVRRLRDGAIGDIQLLRCYWDGTRPWTRARKEGMTEMEYQMRNWYYFTWLCGDHIAEQHIHNLDVCNWIMGAYPETAQGQGGCSLHTSPDQGEIFDHHFVEFTYPDGTKMFSQCRQIQGCWNSVSEHAVGTLGTADISGGRIASRGGWKWRFQDESPNPYQVEHDDLFAAIRADLPYNEAEYGALSTMTSIFGRMATYSGQKLDWSAALASDLDLSPASYAWDADPPVLPGADGLYPLPLPGTTIVL